ncbi:MAG: aryl-sulfate sulfotransferase, partial [Bacteroidota bacterium]
KSENGWYAYDTLRLKTENLPDLLPEISIIEAQTAAMESGFHFANFHRPVERRFQKFPFLFDDNGLIRWFLDLSAYENLTFPLQRFEDGNWYLFQENKILVFSMLGEELGAIDLGPTYRPHHDLIEIPNGNLIVMVNKEGTMIPSDTGAIVSWGDHLIEVDRRGSLIREWDMREVLDVGRYELKSNAGGDWFHGNAVWYDPADKGLIISGRNQGIVKVSQNNELIWILAPHRNWQQAGANRQGAETKPYLLQAVQANGAVYSDSVQLGVEAAPDFDWAWGQHAPSLLPNGHILVFDNGFARQYDAAPLYSRVVEYAIDPQNKSVQEINSYGESRGAELYSRVISNAQYLPQTGNFLMVPGIIRNGRPPQSRLVEYSPMSRQVVFEASLLFKNSGGTGVGWGNMDVVYRGGRMTLYP